jgi:hypothetical protein
MQNPGDSVDPLWKYIPPYAGPDNGGVVGKCMSGMIAYCVHLFSHIFICFQRAVCGSENEISPNPIEDDHFDVTNRKVEPGPIDYASQKTTVWIEVVLSAEDQLCQRLAFGLSKIFATSTDMNSDSFNTGVFDCFVLYVYTADFLLRLFVRSVG